MPTTKVIRSSSRLFTGGLLLPPFFVSCVCVAWLSCGPYTPPPVGRDGDGRYRICSCNTYWHGSIRISGHSRCKFSISPLPIPDQFADCFIPPLIERFFFGGAYRRLLCTNCRLCNSCSISPRQKISLPIFFCLRVCICLWIRCPRGRQRLSGGIAPRHLFRPALLVAGFSRIRRTLIVVK